MGATFTCQLKVDGHLIPDVAFTWGFVSGGDMRQDADSFGTDVEVPAVIELLNLVCAGKITAADARDSLNALATSINERMDREYEQQQSSERRRPPVLPTQKEQLDAKWVYVISAADTPEVVKIGVAADIPRRLKALQIGSAVPLVLRWNSRGGYLLERHLHEKFDKKRISGEWFRFGKTVDPVKAISKATDASLQQFDDPPPVAM